MTLTSFLRLGIAYSLSVIDAQGYDRSLPKNVCGTDGTTYETIHDLNEAQIDNPDLQVFHYGSCVISNQFLSEPTFPNDNTVYFEKSGALCPYLGTPVCGSDGKTYGNECLLNYQKSFTPELHTIYKGWCGDTSDEDLLPTLLAKENGNDALRCPLILKPVCANDGKTYENECMLKFHKTSNSELKIKHRGLCKRNPAGLEMLCSTDLSPVCGTDGKSYGNICLFNTYKKFYPNLHIEHIGFCEDNINESGYRNNRMMRRKSFNIDIALMF